MPVELTPPKLPFRPSWTPIDDPTEHEDVPGANVRRFEPRAGAYLDNEFLGEPEILLAGLEGERASLRVYQPEVDRYSRLPIDGFFPDDGMSQIPGMRQPGLGAGGGIVALAGGDMRHGDGDSSFTVYASTKVAVVDAKTKAVAALPPMKTPRVSPMVAVSPDGRYVLVAGGLGRERAKEKSVELFDRKAGEWIDPASVLPGLEALPEHRFGGAAIWVTDRDPKKGPVHRIVIAGGSSELRQQSIEDSVPLASAVVYSSADKGTVRTVDLAYPRLYPALAARDVGGRTEIVIAGGGTGRTAAASGDPQVYAVELLDPTNGKVSFGQHLPKQKAIVQNGRTVDWGPNTLVFATRGATPSVGAVTTAYLFGFSAAYRGAMAGAPLPTKGGDAPEVPAPGQGPQTDRPIGGAIDRTTTSP